MSDRQQQHDGTRPSTSSLVATVLATMACLVSLAPATSAEEESPAVIKADANAFFKEAVQRSGFIATDKGSRGWDNTSVRFFRDGYVKSVSRDGCTLTIAHDKADLGDPRNGTHREGPATITISWSQVKEDASDWYGGPQELLLRSGITTSMGTSPALRIMYSITDWPWHAKRLQQACRR
jgi:hypothetical protein